ncbi:hypothetical protein [Arthrobacter sp. 260]|uniref:hypothetical protein n=1 Tax=Arthrobacter sp. 260 TaxID=2735314 RepID=UPI0014912923|nr:hypothetical protein [Arthrobacter sp. 260]NOJ60194.1 hypothetical protein [Arthrobacter sp. 260]
MKYRARTTESKNVLAGSERDLYRIQAMSQEALDKHPAVADGVEQIKMDLLAETADARQVVDQSNVEAPAPRRATRWSGLAIFAVIIQALTFLAAGFAGFVLLPPRQSFNLDLPYLVQFSTVGAYITIVLVILGLLLPAPGDKTYRRQSWQLYGAEVLIVAVGVAVGLNRSRTDADAAEANWTPWLIANLVAAVLLLALTARGFAASREEPVELEPQDVDRDYFTAIHGVKRGAIDRLETLMNGNPQEKKAVDHEWQSAVKTASRKRQISKNAAAHASRTTAWRWQLELVAEPDYKVPEEQESQR